MSKDRLVFELLLIQKKFDIDVYLMKRKKAVEPITIIVKNSQKLSRIKCVSYKKSVFHS